MADTMRITIYTDGACDNHADNQPGGWAAILQATDDDGAVVREKVISGGAENTTNNRMELKAVIEGLKALKRPSKITVVTDSRYVKDIATGAKKVSRNKSLWQEYYRNAERHHIDWKYVAGHSGDVLNERCDRLAVKEKRARAYFHSGSTESGESAPETAASIYVSTAIDAKKKACAFAAQIIYPESAQELSEFLYGRTEQEATLIGAIRALEKLRPEESATVYTAQEYLAKGMNAWVKAWNKNNWKTRYGSPVKYKRHWQRLRELSAGRIVHFQFVKARQTIPYFQIGKEIAADVLNRA